MSNYAESLRRHFAALDAHDAETRRLHEVAMTTNVFPPAGTFPAREDTRRGISARLEEAARGLLAEHDRAQVSP
jgi:hypothetical protein